MDEDLSQLVTLLASRQTTRIGDSLTQNTTDKRATNEGR